MKLLWRTTRKRDASVVRAAFLTDQHSGGMSNQERVAERRKHWGELIARQQQSGKTVKAFCEEN